MYSQGRETINDTIEVLQNLSATSLVCKLEVFLQLGATGEKDC